MENEIFAVGDKVWIKIEDSPVMLVTHVDTEDSCASLVSFSYNGVIHHTYAIPFQLLTHTNPDDVTP